MLNPINIWSPSAAYCPCPKRGSGGPAGSIDNSGGSGLSSQPGGNHGGPGPSGSGSQPSFTLDRFNSGGSSSSGSPPSVQPGDGVGPAALVPSKSSGNIPSPNYSGSSSAGVISGADVRVSVQKQKS